MFDELIAAVLEGVPDAELTLRLRGDEYHVRATIRRGNHRHSIDRLMMKAEALTTHDPSYTGHYIGRCMVEEIVAHLKRNEKRPEPKPGA